MIICKWPDPLVDHFQVTRVTGVTGVTGVTRGDGTEGGERGGEGVGEEEEEGKLSRTGRMDDIYQSLYKRSS